MNVEMFAGSLPPDPCGVGDYTAKLAAALGEGGATIRLVKTPLGILEAIRFIKVAGKGAFSHIQYPTVGFGNRLGPHFLSLFQPGVVTLHEVSKLRWPRRLSLFLFAFRSRHLIFTTEYERRFATRWAPWIRSRSTVIPVASAIDAGSAAVRDIADVVHFGLLRPQKGIEDVLEVARLLSSRGSPRGVRFIGTPDPRKDAYFQGIRRQAAALPVRWEVGLAEKDVADRLSRTQVAYMPFPDGAQSYRTSLLALLANGVAVVTTKSENTPEGLAAAVVFAATPQEAMKEIEALWESEELRTKWGEAGRRYAARFSWKAVAERHVDVYRSLERGGVSLGTRA